MCMQLKPFPTKYNVEDFSSLQKKIILKYLKCKHLAHLRVHPIQIM